MTAQERLSPLNDKAVSFEKWFGEHTRPEQHDHSNYAMIRYYMQSAHLAGYAQGIQDAAEVARDYRPYPEHLKYAEEFEGFSCARECITDAILRLNTNKEN